MTNPPFASVKGMNTTQKDFLKNNYELSNCDTCVAFIEAIGHFLRKGGVCGVVSQNAWMYLKSFSKIRELFVETYSFRNIVNLGSGAFVDLSGEKSNVSLLIFHNVDNKESNIRVQNLSLESLEDKIKKLETGQGAFCVRQLELNGMNGFSLSQHSITDHADVLGTTYSSVAVPMQGTSTGDSKKLVGYFWEHFNDPDWIPVSKGGGYCRWEGLNNSVVKWGRDGEFIREQSGSALRNVKYFDDTQLVYSDTGTAGLNVRLLRKGQIFIASGPGIRVLKGNEYAHMAFLNSRFAANYVRTISPKLTIAAGYIGRIPIEESIFSSTVLARKAVLCVEMKIRHLVNRPNNLEYFWSEGIGTDFDISEMATEMFKNDMLNEILKLETESQCDKLILTGYGIPDEEKEILNETVGKCAYDIETVQELNISKFDKYLSGILDSSCTLKRTKPSKSSFGCDGFIEYASKDLKINPECLMEQVLKNLELMTKTLEKYKDMLLHNYILHILDYSVELGLSLQKNNILDLTENRFDSQICFKKWLENKFNNIHKDIFKGKPFVLYKDGEIIDYDK